jgi:hypothetical protein
MRSRCAAGVAKRPELPPLPNVAIVAKMWWGRVILEVRFPRVDICDHDRL